MNYVRVRGLNMQERSLKNMAQRLVRELLVEGEAEVLTGYKVLKMLEDMVEKGSLTVEEAKELIPAMWGHVVFLENELRSEISTLKERLTAARERMHILNQLGRAEDAATEAEHIRKIEREIAIKSLRLEKLLGLKRALREALQLVSG